MRKDTYPQPHPEGKGKLELGVQVMLVLPILLFPISCILKK